MSVLISESHKLHTTENSLQNVLLTMKPLKKMSLANLQQSLRNRLQITYRFFKNKIQLFLYCSHYQLMVYVLCLCVLHYPHCLSPPCTHTLYTPALHHSELCALGQHCTLTNHLLSVLPIKKSSI